MGGMKTLFSLTYLVLFLPLASQADETHDGGKQTSEATVQESPPAQQVYPRRIYKVDDVGMIIGGASEDAKAKVGRLPVRD